MKSGILIFLIAYLLGSIPFGYLLVRVTQGTDIRKQGSGNIGATNVFRKSRWAGILTLLLDGGKGYLAVSIAGWMGADPAWKAIAALGAILGHVFTVWLQFKGGKGVATGAGSYLAVCPAAVVTTLALFSAVVLITRYISLASVLATAAFPLWALLYGEPIAVVLWGVAGCIVIIVKHHENIRRLLRGTENRFALGNRQKQAARGGIDANQQGTA
ncbi:MAG: glycerol-3-phosphate 1-O-acyltransferase PlsY [Acidobacteria bacterium]|nr:glycerol-3-phosphate 1-O-acyltransferase PlsY [Acidobacteriota bacterium]